jgi:NAD-dependent SIR2 family protein deacetylase
MDLNETKRCTRCEEEYPIECFYKHTKKSNGTFTRNSSCKYCKGVVNTVKVL